MLPLILGLMYGVNSTEISRLMLETTKRHQEAAEELCKQKEAIKSSIKYKREKFDSVVDNIYEVLEEYDHLTSPEFTQERIINIIEDICDKLQIDKIIFFELLYKELKNYFD